MLKALGRRVTRRLLGDARSPDGLLLTRSHYLEPGQEWQLGLAVLGLSGFPVVVAIFIYVQIAYDHLRLRNGRIRLGHWSDLSPEMKILIPAMILCFLVAFCSGLRLALLQSALSHQPRSDIDA